MAELTVSGPDASGTNVDAIAGVLHMELTQNSAMQTQQSFREALNLLNLPKIPDDDAYFKVLRDYKLGSAKVRPHYAVVIVLQPTAAGNKAFHNILNQFNVARQMVQDSSPLSFSPKLISASDMECFLQGCGEISNVIHAIRLNRLYVKASINGSIIGGGISSSKAGRPSTVPLSTALSSIATRTRNATSNVSLNGNNTAVTPQKPSPLKRKLEGDIDITPAPNEASASEAAVVETVNDDSDDLGPPILCHPLPIYQRDMECLKAGNYVNDTIVDFYIKHLVEKFEQTHGVGKAYAFSSLFYSQLTRPAAHNARAIALNGLNASSLTPAERRYENVKNWVRKLHNLFSTDYIFVPVNVNQHWMLVIVQHISKALVLTDPTSSSSEQQSEQTSSSLPAIVVLDSMTNANPIANAHYHVARYVRQFLECEAKKRSINFDSTRLKDIRPKVPQQNNATDCALYVCQYVECFLENPDIFNSSNPVEPIKMEASSKDDTPTIPAKQSKSTPTVEESPKTITKNLTTPPSNKVQIAMAQPGKITQNGNAIVLLVRDPSDASVKRVVANVSTQSTLSSSPTWHSSPSLLKWFPYERVAQKRKQITELINSLASSSKKPTS